MSNTRVKKTQNLLPIEELGISTIQDCKSADADKRLKESLPIISCECGTEILVVPDLKAMNVAIKTHVAEHRKKERNTKNSGTTSGKISQLLSELTLIRVSQQNNI